MQFGGDTSFLVKYKWFLTGIVLVVILIVGLFFFNDAEKTKNSTLYTTEFIFKEDGNNIEVRVDGTTHQTQLYENGNFEETLSFLPKQVSPVLELPEVDKDKQMDIVSVKEPASELTWDSTLEESAKYLNYLDSEGYKIVREAHTSQFIEIIAEFKENRKRIVIFNHIIMVGDLAENAKLPNLDEYLKDYRN